MSPGSSERRTKAQLLEEIEGAAPSARRSGADAPGHPLGGDRCPRGRRPPRRAGLYPQRRRARLPHHRRNHERSGLDRRRQQRRDSLLQPAILRFGQNTPCPRRSAGRSPNLPAWPNSPPSNRFSNRRNPAPVKRRLTLRAADGSSAPVQLSGAPLEVAGAPAICLVAADLAELEASANSIRVLRQHEQDLEESEELYRQTAETAQRRGRRTGGRRRGITNLDGRATADRRGTAPRARVAARDPDQHRRCGSWPATSGGRITFLNPVAEALTGWSVEEAQGRPIASVFRIINEQTLKPGEDLAARVLREGRRVALANHTALPRPRRPRHPHRG